MLLEGNLIESEEGKKRTRSSDILSRNRVDDKRKLLDDDFERDDECGICMEPGTKMVLPTCGHSLCISCFQDWYAHIPHFHLNLPLKDSNFFAIVLIGGYLVWGGEEGMSNEGFEPLSWLLSPSDFKGIEEMYYGLASGILLWFDER